MDEDHKITLKKYKLYSDIHLLLCLPSIQATTDTQVKIKLEQKERNA